MQRIIRRTILTLFIVLVSLLLIIWGLTPVIARTVLEDFFAENGATFTAESLSLNPFTTEVGAEDLKVTLDNDLEFKLDGFRLALSLLPLFEKKVIVDQIEVRGLQLDITQLSDGWQIAGVKIGDNNAEEETPPPEDESTSTPWDVLLPSIVFTNSRINVTRLGQDADTPLHDELTLNELQVSNIEGQGLNWKGAATLSAVANGATLDLGSSFRYTPEQLLLWLDIKLLTASLDQFSHYVPAPMNQGNLNVTLVGEVVVNQKPDNLIVTATTKQFDIDRISLPAADLAIESERTQLGINSLQLKVPQQGDVALVLDGAISSFNSRISDVTGKNLLASWDSLKVSPLQTSAVGSDFTLSIGQVDSTGLTASQASNDSGQLPALVHLGKLIVDKIDVSPAGAEIDQVHISNLESHVIMDKSRQLTTLVALGSPEQPPSTEEEATSEPSPSKQENTEPSSEQPSSEQPETPNDASEPFYVILHQLSVDGESSVHLTDGGVTPALERTLFINSLTVEGINTKDPQQAIHVVLDGKTDKYSIVKTDTRLYPFAEKLSLDTRTELTEAQMPPFSPYVAEALGYDIESGQLDMNIALTIDQGILDGKTMLTMREFDLSGSKVKEDNVKDASAIPLNVAVGMLKDSQDNIELEIPMSGNIDDPEFGWGSFLSIIFKKALFKATTSYVMQTFVPYANVISIAQIAGEQMLKVRVEPLKFPATQTAIEAEQKAFLEELAKLMKDKEDAQLKACPYATPADLGLPQPPAALSDEQLKTLKEISSTRGEAVKDFLISQDIKSSRVLLCSPGVDSEAKAEPRLEFDL
ncbi:hypothetical protein BTA51_17825 [Hahella sp. CCB-MM4]|uniref:DUF748 domain-containing protein n=1 Tax=Hahella sp. (strain CCB-MM4) TaxID=1926491 RepID=UPI000B9C4A41|nr:DUF748 domain-containing protein [Hahella sp. CCB-MM4]OZG71868.1 hypothetical protein BTA51_17825 [Hahella sp. CCB-MM4]